MEKDELAAWLRLTLSPGVGNDAARRLLAAFGLPQAIFEQTASALQQVVPPPHTRALLAGPPKLAGVLATTSDWLQAPGPNGCGPATEWAGGRARRPGDGGGGKRAGGP